MAVNLKLDKNFYSYLEQIQKETGQDYDVLAKDFMEFMAKDVTTELFKGIERHHRTGRTARALDMNPQVQKVGGKYSVSVGFEMPDGLPARYINKGTPTNRPKDPFVDRALNKNRIKTRYAMFFDSVREKLAKTFGGAA